jgi:hypothetical protein
MIGDPYETLRDRSIIVIMTRGVSISLNPLKVTLKRGAVDSPDSQKSASGQPVANDPV